MSQPKPKNKRRLRPNYFNVIMSVALVLFVAGLLAMFMMQGNGIVQSFKEKLVILVEISPEAGSERVDSLRESLKNAAFLKNGSLTYTPKEEALLEMQEAYEHVLHSGMPNPLYDMFSYNVKASYVQNDSLKNMKQWVETLAGVEGTYFQEGVVQGLAQDMTKVSWIAIVIGILLLLVAVALIHHTVKLSLYANRFIIKNMQLVGASNGYILRPYIGKALVNGVLSALLAVTALWLVYQYLIREVPGLQQMLSLQSLIVLFLIIILAGACISAISTYFTVTKYLKTNSSSLY